MKTLGLRESDGTYRAVFNSMIDAVLVADRENKFIDANAAALDLIGSSREEILGQSCSSIFAHGAVEHICFMRETILGGRSLKDRKEAILTSKGQRVTALVTSSPLIGTAGQVAGIVYILRDAGSMKQVSKDLRRKAATDDLTGLANRRELRSGLEVEVARAKRHRRAFSILMMDLDGFKAYNDSNGHPAGDEALKTVGRLLLSDSRTEDIVARYGGEEFVIVLPESSPEEAARKAERIRSEIASWPFTGGRLTASIGILNWNPSRPMEVKDILRRVDEALYEAKRKGKNRVAVRR